MTREEALKIAGEMRHWLQTDREKEALETLIPELRESEDERIRKELIAFFNEVQGIYWHDLAVDDILAWLEKQKEQPNIELIQRSWYLEGYHDREFLKEPMWCVKAEAGGPKFYKNPNYGKKLEPIKDVTINGEPINTEPQQVDIPAPTEWSEADEEMFNDILLDMADRREMFKSKGETTFAENTQKKIDWLDSHHLQLKYQSSCPQPKQEWSEENKKTLDDACCWIAEYAGYLMDKNYGKASMLMGLVDKLKSLRPSWKPSKEQMEALQRAIDACECEWVYEDTELRSLLADLQTKL